MLKIARPMTETKLSIDAPAYVVEPLGEPDPGDFGFKKAAMATPTFGRRESNIQSKISRIFAEAKKRNPDGYSLKQYETADVALSPSSCSTSSVQISRSQSTSPVNLTASSSLNPYSMPFYSASSRHTSVDEDERERLAQLKFRNPKSGQVFCLLATTVNVPNCLEPLE